jgi:hypothetical protein
MGNKNAAEKRRFCFEYYFFLSRWERIEVREAVERPTGATKNLICGWLTHGRLLFFARAKEK